MTEIAVVGAGIVGICCALSLRRRGHAVCLLDRGAPATETSYGNSGLIANCGIHPLANPSLIPHLPRLLLNRDTRLQIEYAQILQLTPWLGRFFRQLNSRSFAESTRQIAGLTRDAVDRHRKLMEESGSSHLLNDTGFLVLHHDRISSDERRGMEVKYDLHGVSCEYVSSARIRELEPALLREYPGGLWFPETPSVRDPHLLSRSYFDRFVALGGDFSQCPVNAITRSEDRWTLLTPDESLICEQVVIAAGAWSPPLLKPLGVRLPFIQERGYHMMFAPVENVTLQRPISDSRWGFVITPMAGGIRATTGANLTASERKPNPVQFERLRSHLRNTIPLGRELMDTPWMGRRTSTANSIPLVGPLKRYPGLHVATGHGHLGLTLSPITGELIADAVEGRQVPEAHLYHTD